MPVSIGESIGAFFAISSFKDCIEKVLIFVFYNKSLSVVVALFTSD
jgi:methyl coenzyme M reductase subunit C-like uncharacterized protein (methanogenesis marker protein 7)